MKRLQEIQTYIDLTKQLEEQELINLGFDPNVAIPGIEIHRDALLDKKHQAGRYAMFVGKTALKGLEIARKGIEYTLARMIEDMQRDRARKAELAKQGIEIKYRLF